MRFIGVVDIRIVLLPWGTIHAHLRSTGQLIEATIDVASS